VSPILAFVRLSRLPFLFGGFAGVALGAAVAAWTGRPLDVAAYLWAQAMVTAFQLMVHYANDYFDREVDVRATPTGWSGGSGVLPAGDLSHAVALRAAVVCAALGLVATAHAAVAGNPALASLGVAIFVLAWSYSAPPLRLAARGLGEIDTVLVVAVLVPCAGYAAFAGTVGETMLRACIAPAAAMFAMMLSVGLPDAGTDFLGGKKTLVVRWGPSNAWRAIWVASGFALAIAAATAWRAHAGLGTLALVPAVVCGGALIRLATRDPRPASMAFWGVALYATTAAGLAAAYAAAAVWAPPR
jgi:1,4-dihydroxy-2-naphthoate polyprenyltransferase